MNKINPIAYLPLEKYIKAIQKAFSIPAEEPKSEYETMMEEIARKEKEPYVFQINK